MLSCFNWQLSEIWIRQNLLKAETKMNSEIAENVIDKHRNLRQTLHETENIKYNKLLSVSTYLQYYDTEEQKFRRLLNASGESESPLLPRYL